jgi:hypothetical protein
MVIQLISSAKRPNIETPWVPEDLTGKGWYNNEQHFLDVWHEKGRLLSVTVTLSEDKLTATVVREFADWQALDDFISDPDLNQVRVKRNAYNDQVGIETLSIDTKEV